VNVFDFTDEPNDGRASNSSSAIVNSTIIGNTGDDVQTAGLPESILEVSASTIGGINVIQQKLTLTNSVVGDPNAGCITSYGGVLTVTAPVLSPSASCMPSIQLAANLGPLQDNGGPTPTRLPLAGSPAIDAGDCTETTDQRELARPATSCDLGAVELQSAYPMTTNVSATLAPADATLGAAVATALAIDPEGNPLTFAITGGNTGGAFAIDPATGDITVANPGAVTGQASFTLEITVTDRDPN
jgi:hypothetical protein